MDWRSWSSTNPCPVCSGHAWAGRSAEQCRGGYNIQSPDTFYCSVKDSGNRREKTWLWLGDEPYPWTPEPEVDDPTPVWQRNPSKRPADIDPQWNVAGAWDYFDEHGNYAYSVIRFDAPSRDRFGQPLIRLKNTRSKDYRPGRMAHPGHYRWGLTREQRIPYRLPQLIAGIAARKTIWIVEGEKSADILAALGEVATTMPGGSASWIDTPWLRDVLADVIVDNDEAGTCWQEDVAKTVKPDSRYWSSLTEGLGDDVVDHLRAGFGLKELRPWND